MQYSPQEKFFQKLPVREKVEKIEINWTRNGYNTDTLTSVYIQEVIDLGGKVIKLYVGVIEEKKYKPSRFRKVFQILFNFRQKYRVEGNDNMEKLLDLMMNSFFAENMIKDITEEYVCKSESWLSREYMQRVLDYWRLPIREFI